MDCIKKYDFIGYLDGAMSEGQKAGFELHLAHCETCKNSIFLVQQSLEIVEQQKKVRANPYLFTKIQQRIAEKEFVPFRVKVLRPVIIVGIVVFSLFLGIILGNSLPINYNNVTKISDSIYWNEVEQESIEMAFLK